MRQTVLLLTAAATLAAALPVSAQQYPYPAQPQLQYAPQTQYGAPVQTQYAQPMQQQSSGSPLSSIFQCQAPGNKQAAGALVGALVGGVAGNQVSDRNKGLGTVLGAAIGAAAGSYIGCRMQQTDQLRAQNAALIALENSRSESWSNPQTGASGRVDVIDTYYGQGGYGAPAYVQPVTVQTARYAQGVERPREYQPSAGQYQAASNINIRSGPSERAPVVGTLRAGEIVDGLVRVEGSPWVLAVRDGMAIGYVSESVTRFIGDRPASAQGGARGQGQRQGPPCHTFDQTFMTPGAAPETQRYKACKSPTGEWLVQA